MDKEPLSLLFWETAESNCDKEKSRSARVIAQCEWDDEWRCPMELGCSHVRLPSNNELRCGSTEELLELGIPTTTIASRQPGL